LGHENDSNCDITLLVLIIIVCKYCPNVVWGRKGAQF
jgi:hypothetical protein